MKITRSTDAGNSPRLLVWDLPVRLFHWTLLLLTIALIVTAELLEDASEPHGLLGLALLALVLFRIVWGVIGGTHARFSGFLHGPRALFGYARSLFARQPHFVAGHNPLGGWMVLVLLIAMLSQSVTGLFSNDDILFEGPLAHLVSKETSDLLTGLHEDLFHAILILIGLHLSAIVGHRLFQGENLVTAMFTGYKELPPGAQAQEARGGNPFLALIVFATCAALVYGLLG